MLSICSGKVYMLCLLIVARAKYEVVRSTSQNVSLSYPAASVPPDGLSTAILLRPSCKLMVQETYNAYALKTRSSMGGINVRTETYRVGSDEVCLVPRSLTPPLQLSPRPSCARV